MKFPKLNTSSKSHWTHSDCFESGEFEFIKSFIHHNYDIGYHTHSFYELNIVLNGNGYHYIEEMVCEAKPGCVFLIPPYIRHGYVNKGNLNVYHMLIHREFIEKCFGEFRGTEAYCMLFETEPFLRAHYNENMYLILSEKDLYNLRLDIDAIEDCHSIADCDIFINAIAKKILCRLCVLMANHSHSAHKEIREKKELMSIADCLNYIHRNFDEKITVKYLAERLKTSRSTFIRQFTRICGVSPHRYIQDFRIKKAKEYITDKHKTSTDVAQQCGFYDVSHMRKYLKDEM